MFRISVMHGNNQYFDIHKILLKFAYNICEHIYIIDLPFDYHADKSFYDYLILDKDYVKTQFNDEDFDVCDDTGAAPITRITCEANVMTLYADEDVFKQYWEIFTDSSRKDYIKANVKFQLKELFDSTECTFTFLNRKIILDDQTLIDYEIECATNFAVKNRYAIKSKLNKDYHDYCILESGTQIYGFGVDHKKKIITLYNDTF